MADELTKEDILPQRGQRPQSNGAADTVNELLRCKRTEYQIRIFF